MTRFLFASLLLATAAPAFAAAPEQHFTRDGATYVYTTEKQGDRTVVRGRNETTGETFALLVQDSAVSGTYAGQPVSFSAKSAVAKPAAVELSAR